MSNLSEKEIKRLKRLINNKDVFYYEDDFNNKIRPLVGKLLDLYNKEKEEKEKFKKALGKRITYCNELEKDLFENCSNYVISKEKVREKIKQLDEVGTKLYWHEEIVEMFKELLEE